MKRLTSLSLTLLMILCLAVASERRAWGYVDPGTGLIALQTFASAAAAYLYIVRRRLRGFFARKEPKPVRIPVGREVPETREVA